MRKIVAVAAALLVLTGCTSEPAEVETALENVETNEVEPAAGEAEESSGESELPLQSAEPGSFESAEDEYLHAIKKRTDIATVVESSDDQLIEAGLLACEILAENPSISEIRLVEGEKPAESGNYFTSQVVATHAQMFICPEVELAP